MSDQLRFGEALRDQGMARVLMFTPDEWKARAFEAIVELAKTGEPFTSEQLREIVGDPPKPNAMGSIFNAAAMKKIIVHCGWRKASRPGMHATDLREWIGRIRTEQSLSPVGTGGGA